MSPRVRAAIRVTLSDRPFRRFLAAALILSLGSFALVVATYIWPVSKVYPSDWRDASGATWIGFRETYAIGNGRVYDVQEAQELIRPPRPALKEIPQTPYFHVGSHPWRKNGEDQRGVYYGSRGWRVRRYQTATNLWPYVGKITAISLFLPIAYLVWKKARAVHRDAKGLCLVCGYDLRASTGRCPECGALVDGK